MLFRSSDESVEAAVKKLMQLEGTIDLLVNNAGFGVAPAGAEESSLEQAQAIFDTNFFGVIRMTRAVVPHMRRQGSGRIINIASTAGLRVLPQIGVYCMSKAAVIHMTRAMALEWGKYDINVNAICPGYIDTEINHHHWQTEQGQKLINMLPRKRVGQPQDLDALLVMLCSKESHFINGAVIAADDGFSA